jgi:hypothetical protein
MKADAREGAGGVAPKSTRQVGTAANRPCASSSASGCALRAAVRLTPFLQTLWSTAMPGAFGEFRWFRGERCVRREFLRRGDDGNWYYTGPHNPEASAFFSLNPRVEADGRAIAVEHYLALFVDIDDWSKSAPAFEALYNAGVGPSAVVASGTPDHYHIYYLLEHATPVAVAQPVAQRLCAYLGSDPVHSPAQCPRLPGSISPKHGRKAELLDMVEVRHDLVAVDAALDAVGAPPAKPLASRPSPSRPRRDARALLVQPAVDAGRIEAIWGALPAWSQNLIVNGWTPAGRYPSRSEADAAAVRALMDAGAEDDEIEWFFTEYKAGIGERYAERGDDYLDRTIDFIRRCSPDEDFAFVEGVRHSGAGSRVVLDLDVYFGPHEGAKLQHGVNSTSTSWRYPFLSACLEPATTGDAGAARALIGRDVRVRIETVAVNGEARLEVKRFLPQLPEMKR